MNARAGEREADAPARAPDAPARAAAPAEPGVAGAEAQAVLTLQRTAGNSAVRRMLARQGAAAPPAPAPAAPDWSTQANAEATATATRTRLRTQLIPHMASHANLVVKNTAELFTGSSPLLTMDAITQRSDSAAELAKPSAPAWADPTLYDAFFTGTSMNNTDFHQKRMIGTLEGTTMYVRGHKSDGTLLSLEEMAGTVTHEVSHFLVKQYGELPKTDVDSASFDRYADEFRAYFIEYGRFPGLTGADRAKRIREHLVGTAGDPTSGYPDLHAAYYSTAPGPNVFKQQVDALTGPIGFNLTNSIRLHRLWQLFQDQAAGRSGVDEIVLAIDALPVAERKEAAGSTLISGLAAKLGGVDARRVRAALDAPTTADYVGKVNPAGSPAIAAFLAAIVSGSGDAMKKAYASLSNADRRVVWRSVPFMVYVDHHLLDSGARACLFSMTETGNVAQYDAMAEFVGALGRAKGEADAGTLTGVPAYVTEAMGKLHDFSRWTFFSWGREGAMKEYVDVLPKDVAFRIRERLRD